MISYIYTLQLFAILAICNQEVFVSGQSAGKIARYNPFKGYFITFFKHPLNHQNCSLFWASNEFFLLEGCFKSSLKGLHFYIRDEKISKIRDIKIGALLEFSEILTYKIFDGLVFSIVAKNEKGDITDQLDIEIHESLGKNDKFSIPKSDILNSLNFNGKGKSTSVRIMNANTFVIPHLSFVPFDDDQVFFWVGTGSNGPDDNGTQIPNQDNSYEALGEYKNEMVVLTLPMKKKGGSKQMTVYDINYIGLWSPSRQYDYDYVRVSYPDDPVPYFAPPTYYFNRYLVEGIALCPPQDTVSPTIKYNLTHTNRTCVGDCCNVVKKTTETAGGSSRPKSAESVLLIEILILLMIIPIFL